MPKRRANMSIDGDVLDVAEEHGLNVSAISEKAIREAGRRAQAEAWKKRNAHVLAARLERIEKHGTQLGDIAAFQFTEADR